MMVLTFDYDWSYRMLPWILIINYHDTKVEYFETKSEASVRAIELKNCHCEVVGAASVSNFVSGKKVSSFTLGE